MGDQFLNLNPQFYLAQLAGGVEYTNCISAGR